MGRDILDRASLVSRLESMQQRHARHGNAIGFEVCLGLTFASNELVDELAQLVRSDNRTAFAERMAVYQDRFRSAPGQIRNSLAHHLGRRRGRLESFDDLPDILTRLRG